jgi:GNAT superfamily N-acetyltransferase
LAESALDFTALHELKYFKAHEFPEAIRGRLESGDLCHGYFLDRELVNLGWTSRGYLEPGPGVRINDKACIAIYDCYTLPAFRSRGFYTESLIRMLRQICDEGASHALISVDPDNIPSVRAIEKVGFKPLYRLTVSQRFGRKRLLESGFRARFQTQA